MKKLLSLILALVLCLGLCACGSKNKNAVIGEWEGIYTDQDGGVQLADGNKTKPGDLYETKVSIFKGGAVQMVRSHTELDLQYSDTGTWEISDGILVFTFSISGGRNVILSWEINTKVKPNTLTFQGENKLFPAVLTKVG